MIGQALKPEAGSLAISAVTTASCVDYRGAKCRTGIAWPKNSTVLRSLRREDRPEGRLPSFFLTWDA